MSKSLLCRVATPFLPNGDLDETSFRLSLGQFIEHRVGIMVGSSGTGEGYALTEDELLRLYAIAVEVCQRKIPVFANPPEQHTARNTLRLLNAAKQTGIDAVTLFALAGWHGMRPTAKELDGYFDTVLSALDYPTILAINPHIGYNVKVNKVIDICRRYTQITAIVLAGVPDTYAMELVDGIDRKIDYFVPPNGSMNALALGATGIFATDANIIPKTYRDYIDSYDAGDLPRAAAVYRDIRKLHHFVEEWMPSNARWVKMYMKAFGLPGGEGGLREPYQMPPAVELEKFVRGALALGIPEIEAQARRSGLLIP